ARPGRPRPLRRRHEPPRRGAAAPDAVRRAQPDQPAADARGAVPAPLRRRARRRRRRRRGGSGGERGGPDRSMTQLTATGTLARFNARRDRRLIAGCVVALVLVVFASSSSVKSLYPTTADRAKVA